jgi:hypothetical protein
MGKSVLTLEGIAAAGIAAQAPQQVEPGNHPHQALPVEDRERLHPVFDQPS